MKLSSETIIWLLDTPLGKLSGDAWTKERRMDWVKLRPEDRDWILAWRRRERGWA